MVRIKLFFCSTTINCGVILINIQFFQINTLIHQGEKKTLYF